MTRRGRVGNPGQFRRGDAGQGDEGADFGRALDQHAVVEGLALVGLAVEQGDIGRVEWAIPEGRLVDDRVDSVDTQIVGAEPEQRCVAMG